MIGIFIQQPGVPSIEGGVRFAWRAKVGLELTDGCKPHMAMGIRNFICITPTLQRGGGQSIANLGGQVHEGSMVDHPPCAVRGYAASMDRRQACARRDHERRANFGGEV